MRSHVKETSAKLGNARTGAPENLDESIMSLGDTIFAYFVTRDRLPRLARSIVQQRSFDLQAIKGRSVLIVDQVPEDLPEVIRDFFGSRVHSVDPYVVDEHNHKAVCIPTLRNAAIEAARDSDAEWLFFCDADTVITKFSPPEAGVKYAFPFVYWQKSADETAAQSLAAIEAGGEAVFSEGNSWFILHRDAFRQVDFNEHIIGYGWEDYEFHSRVLAKGFKQGRCNTHVVHIYHTQEEREVHWWQFDRNKAIYESVQLQLDNGQEPDWRRSEPLCTDHTAWSTHLYFDHTRKIVANPLSKTLNPFEVENNLIVIRWLHWAAENFIRNGNSLKYSGPHEG